METIKQLWDRRAQVVVRCCNQEEVDYVVAQIEQTDYEPYHADIRHRDTCFEYALNRSTWNIGTGAFTSEIRAGRLKLILASDLMNLTTTNHNYEPY